jgi:hypothetical protein
MLPNFPRVNNQTVVQRRNSIVVLNSAGALMLKSEENLANYDYTKLSFL